MFRPLTDAQHPQRYAGERVRIDDGGSNDLRLLEAALDYHNTCDARRATLGPVDEPRHVDDFGVVSVLASPADAR